MQSVPVACFEMVERVSDFAAASLNRPSQTREVAKVLRGRTPDMRIVQIALVVMVVIVGLLGYTKPGNRILNAIGFPNACKHGCSYASSAD
jgi:hypothetical protein